MENDARLHFSCLRTLFRIDAKCGAGVLHRWIGYIQTSRMQRPGIAILTVFKDAQRRTGSYKTLDVSRFDHEHIVDAPARSAAQRTSSPTKYRHEHAGSVVRSEERKTLTRRTTQMSLKIDRVLVGEALVGDGNEVAHIDLIMGPRGSAAETAFLHDAHQSESRRQRSSGTCPSEPYDKTGDRDVQQGRYQEWRSGRQNVGPAQTGVGKAVIDCVKSGIIPKDEAAQYFYMRWRLHSLGGKGRC